MNQADSDQQCIELHMRALVIDDGRPLDVFDLGEGDPILMLPMVAELNFVYAGQIEEFTADHRIILYKPRLSTRAHVGIADRANEAVALMDRLGLETAHILVWGDTGSAAYHLAKRWPKRCRSIVFIGLADRYRFPQPYQFLMQLLAYLPIESLVPSQLLASILGRFVCDSQLKPEWMVERASRIPRLAAFFKHSILPNLMEHRPAVSELSVPCLVICGDTDKLVSIQQTQRMADLLPSGTRAVIIPGGQHFVSYVNGSAVSRAIREFYAGLD